MKSDLIKDEIIKNIYKFIIKNNRIPYKKDFPNELVPYDYNKINRMGIKLYNLKLKEFLKTKRINEIEKSIEQQNIINELYALCKKLNRPLKKNDIKKENGINLSYNSLLRRGISFYELDFKKYLYEQNSQRCLNCRSIVKYKKNSTLEFCDISCSTSYNNKKRIRIKKSIKLPKKKISLFIKKEIRKCLWCNSELFNSKSKKYCNATCYEKLIFSEKFINWYSNDRNFNIKNPRLIKGFLETMHGYKCTSCGISKYNGEKITLQLEHIDGDHLNNRKENVCLLCPNCHSQTKTYKGRNINNGTRFRRKERYRQGKSY